MTTNDGPGVPPERAPETTSVFRADFLVEAEPPAREQPVSGVDALPAGPLAVTHVGGGACTLARYIAATRPGASQIVLEPDTGLTEFVRTHLPLPRRSGIRIRGVDGRTGITALADASADLLVLDAFHGGRVPESLTTAEFVDEVGRVLRPDGVLLANVADGPPLHLMPSGFPPLFGQALAEAVADAERRPLPASEPAPETLR